jgi:tRNA(Ile)-lysidine synthetase-like protein
MANICREDNYLLTELTITAMAKLWSEGEGAIAEGIYDLPTALQRRIVRLAFMKASGGELSFAQTEAACALKEEQSVSLPGGWLIYRRGALYIGRAQKALPQYQETVPLIIDGAWHALAAWGWKYRANYVPSASADMPASGDGLALPAEMASGVCFRTRRAGDAVPSAGKRGRRKIKEIFIDAKIPPYQRAGWPLLCSEHDILWVPRLYKPLFEPKENAVVIMVRRIE